MNRSRVLKSIKNKRFKALGAHIVAEMKRLGVPGVSVAVWHRNEMHQAGFGVTNIEHPLPVTAETLFQIGSISKTMTGTLLMQLVDSGKLDLDKPVRHYLPKLVLSDATVTQQLTTRHLLTHMGGWVGDYFNDFGNGDTALERMVKSLSFLPQTTPLGQLWSYNNTGFNIAGRIIEVITKKPYEHVAHQSLFEPLGMTQSLFYPDDALLTRRYVAGHLHWGNDVKIAQPWAIGRAANPVGGVLSTVVDLMRYAQFHSGDGSEVLSPESLHAMKQVQVSAGGRGDMGLTWFINQHGDMTSYGHGGATNGQKATFRFVPDQQFAIAVLTNSNLGSIIGDSAVKLAFELFLEYTPPATVPLMLSNEEVAAYVGTYEYALSRFEVRALVDGQLLIKEEPRPGFPTPHTPAGPSVPAVKAVFVGPDRFMVLDEPRKGEIGDFVRNADGQIAFLRIGGRANPRVATQSLAE